MDWLPDNAEEVATQCEFIEHGRKQQILSHLRALDPQSQSAAIKQIIQTGGVDGRFLTIVLGKEAPGRRDSPKNKKLSPPEVT